MSLEQESAIIEAILFLESDPVDLQSLAKISSLSQDAVLAALAVLQERYNLTNAGLEIDEIAGGFLLIPRPDLWESLKSRYGKKNDGVLSRAALETLSVIAYSQPVTRSEIENIRGVSPDGMIRLLLSKSLIKPVGKKDVPGRPTTYGTTSDFLKVFRLSSIADLPRLDELNEERFQLGD
ncbi:MAG: SMC-Scp complex subunit ScpB [Spirochaetales bacterium]|jgi:segregation and condensation protein B|nr:SMC-Scp complex subunit ScpB [Spirochaetales bacterium]